MNQINIILGLCAAIILLMVIDAYRRARRRKNQKIAKRHNTTNNTELKSKAESHKSYEKAHVDESDDAEKHKYDDTQFQAQTESNEENADASANEKQTEESHHKQDEDTSFPSLNQGIIALHIMAPRGETFYGGDLAQLFYDQKLYFNDKGLFEYWDDNGELVYQVANAVKPGNFSEDTIMELNTPGITIIMNVQSLSDPKNQFKSMLSHIYELNENLGGTLLNEQHERFTQSDVSRCLAYLKTVEENSSQATTE